MNHLKAITQELKEKGINATYLTNDTRTPNLGLHRITIITPNLTKTYHINCRETTPHILTLTTKKGTIKIDLNNPNSIPTLLKTITEINNAAL